MVLRGRLWLITILLILEGMMIIVFSYTKSILMAIFTMCIFSIFTQGAEGAIYGVVPYVSKLYTGLVAGLVSAGGNLGSILFVFGFCSLLYHDATFTMMSIIVIASLTLSLFINIPCHAGIIRGKYNHAILFKYQRAF
jgi:NNP family nitrate/nitrite transporter-like MFS transporter